MAIKERIDCWRDNGPFAQRQICNYRSLFWFNRNGTVNPTMLEQQEICTVFQGTQVVSVPVVIAHVERDKGPAHGCPADWCLSYGPE